MHNSFVEYKEVWEEKITKLSESLVENLRQIKQLKERYKGLKKEAKEESLDTLRELNAQIKTIKKNLKAEGRLWMDLSRNVMQLPEAE